MKAFTYLNQLYMLIVALNHPIRKLTTRTNELRK